MKIGVLIYTYNRTDDARINMEIIRNLWSKNDLLKDVIIVHSYNGKKNWWPEKYLENELLYLNNSGHFTGAELLIDEGMKCFSEKYLEIDYVITLASDTWIIKPNYIEKIITTMKKDVKYLATCPWGTIKNNNMLKIGMALDFNIIDLKWATQYNLFPIKFTEFTKKYSEIFSYQDKKLLLESVFALRFKQAILKSNDIPSENLLEKVTESYVYRMKEREPVHNKKGTRNMYWKNIGLLTHHDPKLKRKILRKVKLHLGEHVNRLISSLDLSYYNNGTRKNTYLKKGSETNYEIK